MAKLNIESEETFHKWHVEEEEYLVSLKKTPQLDAMAMEYVKMRKDLAAAL